MQSYATVTTTLCMISWGRPRYMRSVGTAPAFLRRTLFVILLEKNTRFQMSIGICANKYIFPRISNPYLRIDADKFLKFPYERRGKYEVDLSHKNHDIWHLATLTHHAEFEGFTVTKWVAWMKGLCVRGHQNEFKCFLFAADYKRSPWNEYQ